MTPTDIDIEKLPEFMATRNDKYIVVRYKTKVYVFTCGPSKIRELKGLRVVSGDMSIDIAKVSLEEAVEMVRKMYGDEEVIDLVKEVLLIREEPTIVEEE